VIVRLRTHGAWALANRVDTLIDAGIMESVKNLEGISLAERTA
jgi:hypothetical protein